MRLRVFASPARRRPSLPYAGAFTVYASGTLRARAADRVGNAGPIATRNVVIDPASG